MVFNLWHLKGWFLFKKKCNGYFRNANDIYEVRTLTNRLVQEVKPCTWPEGKSKKNYFKFRYFRSLLFWE